MMKKYNPFPDAMCLFTQNVFARSPIKFSNI